MKTLKNCVMALASVAAIAASGSASATLTNWFLDTDGAGGNAAIQVTDYIDLNGKSYINNSFTSLTTFNFNEAGFFNSLAADSSTVLSPILTSTFVGTGTGNTSTASVAFSTGTLNIFSGATQIGTFDLLAGSGNLLANSTLPNGTFSIIFRATSLAAGYFFDAAMHDLSLDVANGLTFGFATTNALPLATDQVNAADKTRLTNIYNNAFNPDVVTVQNNSTTELLISNNGQFRLAVPEPESLALFGLGLCLTGLSALRRRKENA